MIDRASGTRDFWDARVRAYERMKTGCPDTGAPWHSVACTCAGCLDMDALLIGPAGGRIYKGRLFVSADV